VVLYGNLNDNVDAMLRDIYTEGYYRTAFEIQKGTGVGYAFNRLDTRRVSTAINTAWAQDGRNFSDRLWQNKENLVNSLNETLTQNIIRGENPRRAIDELSKKLGTSKTNAGRLYMTESAAIAARSQNDCYKELGVEEFEFVSTLDSSTCDICGSMDGRHFPMSEYEIGLTVPPLHPNCRCVTVPYFPDDEEEGTRAARNEEGKTYEVPANMTYKQWKEKYIDGENKTEKNIGLAAGQENNTDKSKHEPPVELNNIDYDDTEAVLKEIKKYEHKIVESPIENAIIVTKDGKVTQCFGDLNGVYPDVDLGDMLNEAYVTHNHPLGSDNEYSFSDADMQLFMDYNLKVLRGIDDKYIYELTRNADEVDEYTPLSKIDEFSARHEQVISDAKAYGIGYRRHKRE
jgi:SPP1 gp7 family putative phage head morphogenesis protein